jgi:tetratricopeptide (TPR) repeat protein
VTTGELPEDHVAEGRRTMGGSDDPDERIELGAALASHLLDRYELADGGPTDLAEAIQLLSVACDQAPHHPDRPVWEVQLGIAYAMRNEREEDPADRDAAIHHLDHGLSHLPANDLELAAFHATLGDLCWQRVLAATGSGPDGDLEIVVRGCTAVLAAPDLPPAERYETALRLGAANLLRHERSGSREVLDEAAASLTAAVAGVPEDGDRRRALLLLASTCLRRGIDLERRQWTGSPEDLDTIVACFTELLPVLQGTGVPRSAAVGALGFALLQRAALGRGQPGDLDAAFGHLEEAAETADAIGEHLPTLRTAGWEIVDRCRHGFTPKAMRLAVKLLQRVLALLPPDDPAKAGVGAELAVASIVAYDLGQLPGGLDPTIEALERLLTATPEPHPDRGLLHAAFGAALTRRSVEGSDRRDIGRGVNELGRALEVLPPGHRERLPTTLNLATALYTRFMLQHQASDLDAAGGYLEACGDELRHGTPLWITAQAVRGGILLARANYRQDAAQAEEALALFQQCMDLLPPESPEWPGVAHGLGMALLSRGQLRGDPKDKRAARRWLTVAADRMSPDAPLLRIAQVTAGMVEAIQDERMPRWEDFDAGIRRLRQAVAAPARTQEYAMDMGSLGGLLFGRHLFKSLSVLESGRVSGHDSLGIADLNEAIRCLETAEGLIKDPDATPWWTLLSMQFAMALRRRSAMVPTDRQRSREAGLRGLRGYAWRVLLQAGTDDAMSAAHEAADHAVSIAAWCAEDGVLDEAVQGIEAGRGLVLHAATAAMSVADQLREAGHRELAGEWEAALAASEPPSRLPGPPDRLAGVPSDLRYRVLQTLEGGQGFSSQGDAGPRTARGRRPRSRLLVPPGTGEIRAALRSMAADALVYLVPTSSLADDSAGSDARALIVPDEGPLTQLPLPRLDTDPGSPVTTYVDAMDARRRSAPADRARAADRWRRALEDLCDWAWPAVVGPLLDRVAGWRLGRPARLVLVPVGLLSVVPWHAARRPSDGARARYAVQEAMFSYAASARLLCEVAGRTVLPRDDGGLIVGDPTGELTYAVEEAAALHAAYYPRAVYLGRPERLAVADGTPGQLLGQLAGLAEEGGTVPAVQHLACHAVVDHSPARSHLVLAGHQQLMVDDLLAQARGRRPDAPGATVTLAACTTNLAGRQHDESLTLATAFLVGGACSVVGSLWRVPDRRTSLLMFMLHHYLNETGLACGAALRQAQLWMLDPRRKVPERMPSALAELAHTVDLAALQGWAGFTHQGR